MSTVSINSKQFEWHTTKSEIDLSSSFAIMGVLNFTPDSFSDGGRYFELSKALKRVEEMVEEGADIIDIGGESTRPGALPITLEDEIKRVIPVIKEVVKRVEVPISIDTYKSEIAEAALDEGVEIVNDISGLRFDNRMTEVVADYNAGLVVMHIKGTPRNMQKQPQYDNLIGEIYDYLAQSLRIAADAGIESEKIVIDPGIGFGKKFADNQVVLNKLSEFQGLGRPVMIGPSRKSFIGNALNLPEDQRVEGTIAAVVIGLINGARIFRVHDVKQVKRALMMADKILKA